MAIIHSESVTYAANGTELNGYLAYDQDQQGPRPGVILIHEWWGLTDYIKQRATMLAGLGYCGFAIDMYGGGETADNPDGAGALMTAVLEDMETGTARLRAAFDALTGHAMVDAGKTAAVGYCFGAYILSLTGRFAGCRGPRLSCNAVAEEWFSGHGPLCYVRTD